MKTFRIVIGFLLGFAAYAAAFFLGGLLGTLITNFQFFVPKIIDISSASATSAALAANIAGYGVFTLLSKAESPFPGLAFCICQIVLAAFYLALSLLGADYHLLWYPILSVIINGFIIKSLFTPTDSSEKSDDSGGKVS